MKKAYWLIGVVVILLASCEPFEHLADCNATGGTFICYNGVGRDATYARWNFDSVSTYNVFNIQGSYPAVPGTHDPWLTVNLSFVNSMGNMALETGVYSYFDFISNSGQRNFTFWLKKYEDDPKDPTVKNFVKDPYGVAALSIDNIDASNRITGFFQADVWNMADTTETGVVRFRFTDIELQ